MSPLTGRVLARLGRLFRRTAPPSPDPEATEPAPTAPPPVRAYSPYRDALAAERVEVLTQFLLEHGGRRTKTGTIIASDKTRSLRGVELSDERAAMGWRLSLSPWGGVVLMHPLFGETFQFVDEEPPPPR